MFPIPSLHYKIFIWADWQSFKKNGQTFFSQNQPKYFSIMYRVDEKYATTLETKIFLRAFWFSSKNFFHYSGKGVAKNMYTWKINFKMIYGLNGAQNSEVVKISLSSICKITNNFEKYHQKMSLMVLINTFMKNTSHLGTWVWP